MARIASLALVVFLIVSSGSFALAAPHYGSSNPPWDTLEQSQSMGDPYYSQSSYDGAAPDICPSCGRMRTECECIPWELLLQEVRFSHKCRYQSTDNQQSPREEVNQEAAGQGIAPLPPGDVQQQAPHANRALNTEQHGVPLAPASSRVISQLQGAVSAQLGIGSQFENARPVLSEGYMARDQDFLQGRVSQIDSNAGDNADTQAFMNDVDEALVNDAGQIQSSQPSASGQQEGSQDAQIYADLGQWGLLASSTPYQPVSSHFVSPGSPSRRNSAFNQPYIDFAYGSNHLPGVQAHYSSNELQSTPLSQQPSYTFSTPLDQESNLNLTIPSSSNRSAETSSVATSISPSQSRIRKRRIPGGYRCDKCQAVFDRRTDLRYRRSSRLSFFDC